MSGGRMFRAGLLWLALASALACRAEESEPPKAEFGVLFGGDIQDRASIPLELSPERQELGLRVTFPRPLERDARVSWELERPTSKRGPDGGIAYAAELGERRARPGERRVDAKLKFRRGDPVGTWRIRIRVNGQIRLDRAFEVVEAPR